VSTVSQNFGALDPIEGQIFWGMKFFLPLYPLTLIIGGLKFGIYRGISGIYMPPKFGHSQCPHVRDFYYLGFKKYDAF